MHFKRKYITQNSCPKRNSSFQGNGNTFIQHAAGKLKKLQPDEMKKMLLNVIYTRSTVAKGFSCYVIHL